MSWDTVRKPYEPHIRNLIQLIDLHDQEFTRTGEQFHLEQSTRLQFIVNNLKSYIIDKELELKLY